MPTHTCIGNPCPICLSFPAVDPMTPERVRSENATLRSEIERLRRENEAIWEEARRRYCDAGAEIAAAQMVLPAGCGSLAGAADTLRQQCRSAEKEVERLRADLDDRTRERDQWEQKWNHTIDNAVCGLSRQLEATQAEVRRLEKEATIKRDEATAWKAMADARLAQRNATRAEVERLRRENAKLRHAVNMEVTEDGYTYDNALAEAMRDLADAEKRAGNEAYNHKVTAEMLGGATAEVDRLRAEVAAAKDRLRRIDGLLRHSKHGLIVAIHDALAIAQEKS